VISKDTIRILISVFKKYLSLTKPGIITGNLVTATGGFLLASRGHIDFQLFAFMLLGLAFIIGAGCVFNNVADREIDSHMERTKNRALVAGTVSKKSAIIFGTILGLLGIVALTFHTNLLTMLTALTGLAVYVFVYTPMKRGSEYATLVGSIAGAVPPVVGYTAVTNSFDTGALLLFIILTLWQMPHFYSIAMYRSEEYAAAGVPVLPLKRGAHATKIQILCYIAVFSVAVLLPTFFGYTGYAYLLVMAGLSLAWLRFGTQGLDTHDDNAWARTMFKISLVVLMAWSIMLALNFYLV
jgi:heme o synthase